MAVLTAIAIGSLIYGAVTKTASQIKQGNAAKKAADASASAASDQADLTDWNAKVADLQAADAVTRGAMEESRFREGVRTMIGKQRAGIAGGNIDVNTGSAVDVQADTANLGELDALTIRTNAARQAWGYQVQGQDLRRRAIITRKEGANIAAAGQVAQSASRWAAAGTIVSSVGDAAIMAQRYGFGDKSPTTTQNAPPIG
jgi:hypothetical protein